MRTVPEAMADKVMAAAELFAERGLDATKMEDVASATGIPKATLYYHFSGKEDILAFLFQRVLGEVHRAVSTAASAPTTAAERLRGVVAAHLAVFAEWPAASRALQLDLGRAARLPEIAEQVDRAFLDPVTGILAAGAVDGSLRTVAHPRLVATALLGAVTTSGMGLVTGTDTVAVDQLAAVVSGLVLDGLAA